MGFSDGSDGEIGDTETGMMGGVGVDVGVGLPKRDAKRGGSGLGFRILLAWRPEIVRLDDVGCLTRQQGLTTMMGAHYLLTRTPEFET